MHRTSSCPWKRQLLRRLTPVRHRRDLRQGPAESTGRSRLTYHTVFPQKYSWTWMKLAFLGSKPSAQCRAESLRSGLWLKSSSSQAWACCGGYCPPPTHRPAAVRMAAPRTAAALPGQGIRADTNHTRLCPAALPTAPDRREESCEPQCVHCVRYSGATPGSSSTNTVKKKSKMTLKTKVFLPFQTKLLFWYYKPFYSQITVAI